MVAASTTLRRRQLLHFAIVNAVVIVVELHSQL
jgi:hypothetical protein